MISVLAFSLCALSASSVCGQSLALTNTGDGHTSASAPSKKKPETTEEKLNALEQMLEQQNERLDRLQQTIAEQQETSRLLISKTVSQPEETHPLPRSGADLATSTNATASSIYCNRNRDRASERIIWSICSNAGRIPEPFDVSFAIRHGLEVLVACSRQNNQPRVYADERGLEKDLRLVS